VDGARWWQAAVVGSVVGGLGLGPTGDYGSSATAESLIVPQDGFFGIWGPIYAGALAYAVHQARPSQRDDETLRDVAVPAATAYLTSGLWIWVLDDAPTAAGLGVVATTLGATLETQRRLTRHADDTGTAGHWLVRTPLTLFDGAEVLGDRGVEWATTDAGGAALLVAAATGTAAVAVTMPTSLAYPLAVGWGLLGVVVARGSQHPSVSAAAAGGLALTAGAAWWGRRRGRARLRAVAA
jgi:hypothetical protein